MFLLFPCLTFNWLPETDGDRANFLRLPPPTASSATPGTAPRRGRAVAARGATVAADEEYYDLHVVAGNTSQLVHPDRTQSKNVDSSSRLCTT